MLHDLLKVAISGPGGLIGSRIIELLNQDFEFIHLLQNNLDITDKDQVNDYLKPINFDILLHLAAYTDVDGAEQEKDLAYKINVEGTKNLFDTVTSQKKQFVYISTDFVFDGEHPPYFEDSQPAPIAYYGQTKYEGEKALHDQAMIIRLSYPYRISFAPKKDFVRSIRYWLKQGKTLQMVTDSLITPTFIDDIAHALKYLLNNYSRQIFHIIGADSLSPYDAAKLIAHTFNLDQSLIKPSTYRDYFKDKAKRPRFSEIKTKKNNFCKMKSFREGLACFF